MEIEKLIAAVKLCGSSPRVEQCRECAYWAGEDMSKCIPRMTADAATALEHLQDENDRLRRERDAAVEDLNAIRGDIEEIRRCKNFKWRGPKEK